MSEAVEPPIALPPAAGTSPYKPTGKSRVQIAAVFTIISGVVMAGSVLTPAFTLSNAYGYLTNVFSLSTLPDGPIFAFAGILIAAFGIGSYLTEHRAFQIMIILVAVGVFITSSADMKEVSSRADQLLPGSGFTFTWGPALSLMYITAFAAIISCSFMNKKLP